jgi:hypothetical protein
MRRLVLVVVSVALAGVLTGCSGLRLYSETRDKQGEAVKDSWSKMDAKAVIVAQRENSARLLKEELEAQDRIGLTIRDQTIRRAALGWTGTKLGKAVDEALSKTVGDAAKFVQWADAYQDQLDETAKLRFIGRRFEVRGLELPSCELVVNVEVEIRKSTRAPVDAWSAAQTDANRRLDQQYRALEQQCSRVVGATTKAKGLENGLSGELGTQLGVLSTADAELRGLRNRHQAARNTLRVAQAEYDAAVAEATADPSAASKVAAAADKVGKVIDALLKADDAFSLKLVSETRRDSIDNFFAVLATPEGQALPKDAPKAALALKIIPELFDQAGTALADANKPLLVPLVMRKNHEQLNVEALTREIAAKETRLDIQRSRLELLRAKGRRLSEAKDAYTGVSATLVSAKLGDVDGAECTEPEATGSKGCADQRASVRSAAARYFDATGRLDTEARKAQYKAYGAMYEEALGLAEVNVLQWDALIGASVDQLASYGRSGIKAEHILALINSLTLLWIGSGVN